MGDITATSVTTDTLAASTSSHGNLKLGAVETRGAATLTAKGSGDITATSVTTDTLAASTSSHGNLKLGAIETRGAQLQTTSFGDIKGSGTVKEKLTASTSSHGSVIFMGTTKDANLRSTGFGGITVTKVTGSLSRQASSFGKIAVGNRP